MTALALSPKGVLRPSLSNFIEEWFGDDFSSRYTSNVPPTNIIEFDDCFLIEMAMPGFKKDSISLEMNKNLLTVSATFVDSKEEQHRYRLREFSIENFSKTFKLDDSIALGEVDGTYTDGILEIKLPKKEEAKPLPPKKIAIK